VKEIELPVAEVSTDLSEALRILHSRKRSAILIEHAGHYDLYRISSIRWARSNNVNVLGDLQPDDRVLGPGGRKVTQRPPIVMGAPGLTSGGPASFAPLPGKGHVEVADLVADLYAASPKDLYCDGPRAHDDFPPPNVSVGDDCPHGDGYKVISFP
jgi:hypothetical protein